MLHPLSAQHRELSSDALPVTHFRCEPRLHRPPVVFGHQEAFDYIGSSRVVYEMQQGRFPYIPDGGQGPAEVALRQIRVSREGAEVDLSGEGGGGGRSE